VILPLTINWLSFVTRQIDIQAGQRAAEVEPQEIMKETCWCAGFWLSGDSIKRHY